jgi:hypothetical protein
MLRSALEDWKVSEIYFTHFIIIIIIIILRIEGLLNGNWQGEVEVLRE